jgi:hypothetical protein
MHVGDAVDIHYPDRKLLVGTIAEVREGTASVRATYSFGETTIVVRSGRLHPSGANRWKLELYKAKPAELTDTSQS